MKWSREGGKRKNWLLIKHRDEHAQDGDSDAILDVDRSIASGRSMDQIAAGKGRAARPFMTARRTSAAPKRKDARPRATAKRRVGNEA